MRVLAILMLLPAVAFAQGARPAAGLLTQRELSLDMAVDMARDDGTSPHTVEVARKKAYTALIYRRPSMDTAKAWATQVPPPSIEGTIALGGGFPIRAGDQVVGAIGVSGAPGQDKDEACANAGIAAVTARLK
jgi:uncharacterized protein GlcG (DUF336 family)